MRQVVLDTETTGMKLSDGNRVIEIGCVELVERRPSGRSFHRYLNPGRESEAGALRVHGLSAEFLADKPRMEQVVDEFLDFVRGAELIIHNADFDVPYLDAELAHCGAHYGTLAEHVAGVVDTLKLARELYPGQRVTLDALCRRFDIDNSGRQLHGALLDAGLLADVYLAMTSGQFDLGLGHTQEAVPLQTEQPLADATVGVLPVIRATAEEQAAHAARLEAIERASGQCLWSRHPDPA